MEHRVDEMYLEFKNTASSIAELLALVKQNAPGFRVHPDTETIREDTLSPQCVHDANAACKLVS